MKIDELGRKKEIRVSQAGVQAKGMVGHNAPRRFNVLTFQRFNNFISLPAASIPPDSSDEKPTPS
jgi:hypothetical protein